MDEAVGRSESKGRQGKADPKSIMPIADNPCKEDSRIVGFMYRGNGYGSESAWITCESSDLMDMTDIE